MHDDCDNRGGACTACRTDPQGARRFRIQDDKACDVMGGELSLDNAYVSAYGALVRGRPPAELDVDETCVKEYALSGQRATRYTIVRIR